MPRKKNQCPGTPRSYKLHVRVPPDLWVALHQERVGGPTFTLSARVRLILMQSISPKTPQHQEMIQLEQVMETLCGIYQELQVIRMAIFPVIRYFRDQGNDPPLLAALRALEHFQQTNARIQTLCETIEKIEKIWWSTSMQEKASEGYYPTMKIKSSGERQS